MTKKKKIENLHDGKLDVIAQTFDATERTVTGQTTTDPKALLPAGLQFRDAVLGKVPDEYDAMHPTETGIHKKGEKEK